MNYSYIFILVVICLDPCILLRHLCSNIKMRTVICSTVLLLLWLAIACVPNAESKIYHQNKVNETPNSDSIRATSSTTQEEREATLENEDSDKILFIPTKDWQEVKSYHKLPVGLHIRINLQTGLKEAKIPSEDDNNEFKLSVAITDIDAEDDDSKTEKSNLFVRETLGKADIQTLQVQEKMLRKNIIEALKNIKDEAPDDAQPSEREVLHENIGKKPKFRNYDTLKTEFEHLHLNVESDSEILNRLIKEYSRSDDEIKLNILEDLDFLLHQIDNAINFVVTGGLRKIIWPGLNSTNDDIRKGVMTLLGSASQSNPKVQIAAFEEGFLTPLLRIVAGEKDASISAKAVFALSCIVRGFPYSQQKLIESGGLHTLREVFTKQDWHSLTLQLKVVSLIQDLLEERTNADGDRSKQFGKLDLIASLVEGEWCPAVSSLLAGASFDKQGQKEDMIAALGKGIPLRPDLDMVQKVINTMTHLVPSCNQKFLPTLPLLRSLKETYSEMAYKERFHQGEDGFEFFQNLANQIEFLVLNISRKQEL